MYVTSQPIATSNHVNPALELFKTIVFLSTHHLQKLVELEKMKTISALLLVLAHAGLGGATDFCAPQLKSCASLPQSSAKACSSLIGKLSFRSNSYLLTLLKPNLV
jgi:hypothetical protein